MDAQIIAAIIQSTGTVIAAVVAAGVAGLIGKRLLQQDKLKSDLEVTKKDIAFLLAVEAKHCAKHKEQDGNSYKIKIREDTRQEGFEWSGRFTPSRG